MLIFLIHFKNSNSLFSFSGISGFDFLHPSLNRTGHTYRRRLDSKTVCSDNHVISQISGSSKKNHYHVPLSYPKRSSSQILEVRFLWPISQCNTLHLYWSIKVKNIDFFLASENTSPQNKNNFEYRWYVSTFSLNNNLHTSEKSFCSSSPLSLFFQNSYFVFKNFLLLYFSSAKTSIFEKNGSQ